MAQTLVSTVDRAQITENQTLTLTINYDGATRTDALDLNAIQQDFEVLSSTAGTSTRSINHKRATYTTWKLVVLPKRTGDLVIPSFSLGNIISEAIRIEVLEAGDIASSDEPMFVTLSLDKQQAHVGEQVLATVTLRARGDLVDLGGEAINIDGVEIQLVNESNYAEVKDGINWRVVEWTYSLFPQSDGNIAIPKQTFTAAKRSTQRRGFFDNLTPRGNRVVGRSQAAALIVLPPEPAPSSAPNTAWFPASQVAITSRWANDPADLRVGEPMTRTIEIVAESQVPAAIPPLPSANQSSTNFKEYRDQPELDQTIDKQGVHAVRRESSAIVPSTPGELHFPEQIIDWWDTSANQWRKARLPAETFTVQPAIAAQNLTPPQAAVTALAPSIDVEAGHTTDEVIIKISPFWRWIALLLLTVVVVQFVLLIQLYRRQHTAPAQTQEKTEVPGTSWKTLESALQSGDAKRIHNAIIAWCKTAWPDDPIHTLDSIANKANSEELKRAFSQLNSAVYNEGGAPIDTAFITSELSKLQKKRRPKHNAALAPLYPQST